MKPFEEVKTEIESKFVDLEFKLLIALQFDLDFTFGTPFRFNRMFLNSNFNRIKKS